MAASVLIGMVDGFNARRVHDPFLDRAETVRFLRTLIAQFLTPPLPYSVANPYLHQK